MRDPDAFGQALDAPSADALRAPAATLRPKASRALAATMQGAP
jgi:hypothetical protein